MDAKDLAHKDYLAGMKYKDIAEKYNVSINTVKSWQKRNGWTRKADAPPKKGAPKKKRTGAPKGNKNAVGHGAPIGNTNAVGHGAPDGNLNAVKHGAYQTIYAAYLPEDEREIYNQMPSEADLESEIKLLRLKMARLLNREKTFIYDMYGNRHGLDMSEEDRDKGILACAEQLERLIKTQNQIKRMALDKEEQQARIDKLRAETARITESDDDDDVVIIFGGELLED